MGRAGAKRSKQANDESPTTISASKKRRTEKKKIAPQKIEREDKMDPILKSFCEKFKHPEDSIQFLVQNAKMSVADFIKNHWGTKPLFAESEKVSEDLSKIFSYEFLEEIVGMSENEEIELVPERDFAFSKVVDEKTEEADVAELTKEILKKNYDEKFAVLIHQPERFQDCLWSFMEKLESYLGSLVSCLAVLVPAGTQSQPLRYDDTEKFILQLSGSTNWKLYAPKGAQANAFSDEVKKEEIGEERLAATLKAGDVLYIPKGTIFESTGKEDGVYLDFGTFQDLHHANLLNHTISSVIEEQCPINEDLRLPLPPGYLLRPSLVENDNYADMLTKLAESIRSRKAPVPPADGLIQEFMARRLPPYGVAKFEPELSPQIKKDSLISLRNKEHIVWYTRKSSEDAMDEDADEESADASRDLESRTELVVLSSVNNDKNLHMMIETALTQQEGDAFSIGVEYKPLLEKLEKAEEPIKVEDLTKDIEGGDSLNATILAIALNNIGAICVSK